MFDGVIIGAGPAGCAAAIGLARAGRRVALVEAKAFPRAKVCGEFVSPAATAILESILDPGVLRAAGARRVGTLVLEEGERSIEWTMPRESWVLSRRSLDALLTDAARGAGVEVRIPQRIARVEYSDSSVTAWCASGERINARLVIHADGLGRHDPAGATPMRKGVLGMKCHVRGVPITALRMRSAPGAYIGMVGVEGGEGTIALVARASAVRGFRGDGDALVRAFWPAFDPASRTTPWMTCGVASSGYIAPGHPRSFRIGNAAAAVEPVGGEGIGLALWSGLELARALTDASDDKLGDAHARLARAYRARVRMRRPACRMGAEVLMRPGLVRAMWPVLRATPGAVVWPFYALSGKPVGARA